MRTTASLPARCRRISGPKLGSERTSREAASVSADADAGSGGAQVAQVIEGSPAQSAGIVPGDVITSVDGQQVGSTSDLASAMSGLNPGQRVQVGWVDGNGQPQQATVTLAANPSA